MTLLCCYQVFGSGDQALNIKDMIIALICVASQNGIKAKGQHVLSSFYCTTVKGERSIETGQWQGFASVIGM